MLYRIRHAPDLPGWKDHFKTINLEWLNRYFTVTEADLDQLGHPERILKDGGRILFVTLQDEVIGALALVLEKSGAVELAKMGVLAAYQKKGAGTFLMDAAIQEAIEMKASPLYLETVDVLVPAIKLYASAGFVRVGSPHIHPKFGRTVFRMEWNKSLE
ncbi:MAG: GNAT family N-acetyltransferase [Flavobacteriales bacterium]